MEFKILDAAEAELRAAARYYDAELPGLGLDLTEEFAQVLELKGPGTVYFLPA